MWLSFSHFGLDNANMRLFPALALLYSGFLLVAPSVRQMLLRLDILECWPQFFIKNNFIFIKEPRCSPVRGSECSRSGKHKIWETLTLGFVCLKVNRFMEVGDWKIFYILGINMEPLVFGTKRRILRIEKSFIILWRGVDGGVCQTDGRC